MSVTSTRDIIYNIVNGVTNAGKVYKYFRWANETTTRDTLFKYNGQIRTWMVSYGGYTPTPLQFGDDNRLKEHTFRIYGYMSLDDSANTEDTMSTLAETICNALDDSTTLHSDTTYYDVAQAEMTMEHRTWIDVLCHYVEITQRVTEFRTA